MNRQMKGWVVDIGKQAGARRVRQLIFMLVCCTSICCIFTVPTAKRRTLTAQLGCEAAPYWAAGSGASGASPDLAC